MSLRPAVFLDRDGTLTRTLFRNGKPVAPTSVAEFELVPGVSEAVKRLRAAGFLLIVVTNQPDVRTGLTNLEDVEEMNRLLRAWLPLDDIRCCFHTDADNCDCRKPKPGLLLTAARDHGVDLRKSWMVGDRWRDSAAGKNAGCRSVFIECGYNEATKASADFTVKTFAEASEIILKNSPGV